MSFADPPGHQNSCPGDPVSGDVCLAGLGIVIRKSAPKELKDRRPGAEPARWHVMCGSR